LTLWFFFFLFFFFVGIGTVFFFLGEGPGFVLGEMLNAQHTPNKDPTSPFKCQLLKKLPIKERENFKL
jgi:hypothetical protein